MMGLHSRQHVERKEQVFIVSADDSDTNDSRAVDCEQRVGAT